MSRGPRTIGPARGRPATVSRSARLPAFIGCSIDAARVLAGLRLAVVGAGSVGRRVALHLARVMPAELLVVDPGRYKPESILTQEIGPEDLGALKASNTAARCKEISPGTSVLAFNGGVQDLDLGAFAHLDLVVLATDNLMAELETGRRCARLRVPLIQASLHGASLTAAVRVFGNRGSDDPCPACGFGPEEWRHLERETRFSCEGDGASAVLHVRNPPTNGVSALCALAADAAVLQSLRLTLGLGGPVEDTLLEQNAYTWRTVASPLSRNPDCPEEHAPWDRCAAPRLLEECTLAELGRAAGVPEPELGSAAFTLGDLRFFESAACSCGGRASLRRFLSTGARGGPCPSCGAPLEPDPFTSHRPVPGDVILADAARPLRELTPTAPGWIAVRRGDRTTLILAPRESPERGAP